MLPFLNSKLSAPPFRAGVLRWRVCAVLALLGLTAQAQTGPTYAGRPFLQVARANFNDPAAGFITGFGRAQVIGEAVVFVPLNGANAGGLFQGRGGPLTKVAGPGTATPADSLQAFHDGFARGTAGGARVAFAAGTALADGVWLADGATLSSLLAAGSILPNSGNRAANVLGEPFLVGDTLALIAAHRPVGGTDNFRGVYRVKAGALEAVADTATALPGLGVPDGFSSQVGFDGQSVAFWATRGPFTEQEGMFVQTGTEAVKLIARNGDTFPDGGTMDGFLSPPFVADGAVYFFAYDAAKVTRLLKFEANVLSVLAKDGGLTAEGDALQSLGQAGLAVEDGQVFFPARTARGPGLYVVTDGDLRTVIPPGVNNLGGLRPAAIVLQDVAGNTLVLDVTDTFNNRRLVANLALPAVPVIIASPTNQIVAAGARVEFNVTALGDAPLGYAWQFSSPTGLVTRSTTGTLVIESAGVGDVGFYSVRVTNALGTASSPSFQLNVEVKPEILAAPTNTVVEVGDQLLLRVTALGGLPLSYAWSKDGAPATNETTGLGLFARTSSGLGDAGRYTVVVSNAWGQVTSAEAVVTVNPPAPNPVFAGGRFVKIVDASTPVPESGEPFDTQPLGEHSARIIGNEIVWVGGPAEQPQGGVFRWRDGSLARVLAAGAALPNGLGAAEAFGLIPALGGEALAVSALKTNAGFLQPVGLYRHDDAALTALADTTMAAPEAGGTLFPAFFGNSAAAGGRVIFSATPNNQPALYRADANGIRRVLSASQDLPVVGTATTQLQGLSFDGQTFTVTAATANQQTLVALRVNAAGEVTKLLATGDPLPGTTDTVRTFGPSDTEDGVSTLLVFNNAFAVNVVEWRDGALTRVAGPGMTVGTLGTIQTLETSYPKASSGRSFVAARLTTPGGIQRGIVAASASGIEPVLFAPKLDARRVAGTYVVDSEGDRVLVLVDFVGGGRALYANVGAADEEPLVLRYTRPSSGTWRFTVPQGAALEAAGTLGGTWQPVVGSGEVDVAVDGDTRFFRLRRD
jgi:hypothetical protein